MNATGRLLRDSTSPRLLAYSDVDRILYANDGCNSCIHTLSVDLTRMTQDQLHALAGSTSIRKELIEKIAAIAVSDS